MKLNDSKKRTPCLAFDFGTTNFKAAVGDEAGNLTHYSSIAAPKLTPDGLRLVGDANEYFQYAHGLFLLMQKKISPKLPITMASQRSSFVLWNKKTGTPVTPLISWQDRRAVRWLEGNTLPPKNLWRKTGLPASPHYAGPKLTSLFKSDPTMHNRVTQGDVLFGTLDTYLMWKWTDGEIYQTDYTMASRTLFFDIHKKKWSKKLCTYFSIPIDSLPAVTPAVSNTRSRNNRFTITSSVSDQACAVCAVLGNNLNSVLINLGTGGFVSRLINKIPDTFSGYLLSPIPIRNRDSWYCLEGTVNGLDTVMKQYSQRPCPTFKNKDIAPQGFCLPDWSGIGTPHLKPLIRHTLSKEGLSLGESGKYRIVLEGVIFRIGEIIDGLFIKDKPEKIFLGGGISKNRFIQKGLAALLKTPVYLLEEKEATISGAVKLAQGTIGDHSFHTTRIEPEPGGEYLLKKYHQWKKWVLVKVAG